MSRGIVVGVNWYEDDEKHERVAAAPDAQIRKAIDKLVAGTPVEFRKDVARYLAPFLENNEPETTSRSRESGFSDFRIASKGTRNVNYFVWWKRAYVEEGS